MSQVVIRGLRKTFNGGVTAVDNVDLDIDAGEMLVVIGPSGCGKTTLLRLMCGLEKADAGSISIDGCEVAALPPRDRGVAMVFQNPALFPHKTVADNIAFGLRLRGCGRDDAKARTARAAGLLGITHALDRMPAELSGGEQQRVALARALVREPRVFLFDEPLSSLDAPLRVKLRREILALHARLGTTMIWVTHDQLEAMALGGRAVVMNAGRIEQTGTVDELSKHPASEFVQAFLSHIRQNH